MVLLNSEKEETTKLLLASFRLKQGYKSKIVITLWKKNFDSCKKFIILLPLNVLLTIKILKHGNCKESR